MLLAFVVLNILTIAYAVPYGYSPNIMITMLSRLSCPRNMVWTNGACREIWLPEWKRSQILPNIFLIEPRYCRSGQGYINGECRGVFRGGNMAKLSDILSNIFTNEPRYCRSDQGYINGECRGVFRGGNMAKLLQISQNNVITEPPNCPPGQEYINGICRDVFRGDNLANLLQILPNNVITVPPNCPPGQEYINGECRDIFRGGNLVNSLLFNQQLGNLWNDYVRKVQPTRVQVVENTNVNNLLRHIISAANQCPIGYRPDPLIICRRML